jgi:hypothetical protein
VLRVRKRRSSSGPSAVARRAKSRHHAARSRSAVLLHVPGHRSRVKILLLPRLGTAFSKHRSARKRPSFRSVSVSRFENLEQSGGESVSQFPLKDKAFLAFVGQNPPFVSYAENWRFASNLFMKSIAAHPNTGPTLQFPSALDSRVGWRLPSERSRVRIVSGEGQLHRDVQKIAGSSTGAPKPVSRKSKSHPSLACRM